MVIPFESRSCEICGSDEEIAPIIFKPTSEQEQFAKRFAAEHMDGEQWKNQLWFCQNHFKIAQKYAHLTCEEALLKIKKESHL